MTGTGRRRLGRDWVARLSPLGQVDVARAACPPTIIEDAVSHVGADPVCWAIELSSAVVQGIVEGVPGLGGSPRAIELLRRGNEATTLRALLTLMGSATASLVHEATIDEGTVEGFREFVHRAVPLEQVLQGIRIGHAATTEAFLRECAELVDPELVVEELTAISHELFAFVDDLSDTMIRTYLAEHEVWTTSAAAARADVVRSLLSGAMTDANLASQGLGYDLRRTHEAVLVWSDSLNGRSTLQSAAIEALRARGATATLVVPVASGQLWAWGTVPTDAMRQTESWTIVTQALARHRVQAAFGTPAGGVAGFRRSHDEADAAARVERLRREAGRVPRQATSYADVASIALITTDLDAAGEFVRRELGGLAARSAATEALRTTLYHYLDAERSLANVARRLHVARGTVTYRVNRAKEVLGGDLGVHRLALHLALALAEELGDAVLLPRSMDP